MEAILDFSQPFNPGLLDQIISIFYNPQHPEQPNASKVLYELKDHDHSWSVADSIIENCADPRSVFFGLILLEDMVKEKWLVVNPDQKESIRQYTLGKVMGLSSTMELVEANEDLLHKWDIILVEIFKKEWPNNWTSFVNDLVVAASESESRCRNSIFILKLVVEDVFQFGESTLTSKFSSEIQAALQQDIIQVFQLCSQVLVNTEVPSLLLDTMDIIRLIIKYLPAECVFDFQLSTVLQKFIELEQFQTAAMSCLHEILCHPMCKNYQSFLTHALKNFMDYLKSYIDLNMDIETIYPTLPPNLIDFINELALFLSSVILQHKFLWDNVYTELYMTICHYILFVSRVPNREVLIICMDFWKEWSQWIYNRFHGTLVPGNKNPTGIFTSLTEKVIEFLILHMSRPEEMMMMENEDGEIIRVETKDTEGIALYKTMKESLVCLASVDFDITELYLYKALDEQMQMKTRDFRDSLQHMIWSIGSISGVMNEKRESQLLTGTIMDLLSLIKTKDNKDDKAVIAGCLMYVIQQYPRFLKSHYEFLRVVIIKNFEFMLESHPGVQDMALDTFKKVVKNCGSQLIIVQTVKNQKEPPFIHAIFDNINKYTQLLSNQQKESFYESVSIILKFERNNEKRLILIDNMMYNLNSQFVEIIKAGVENPMVFHSNEALDSLRFILRINRVVCSVMANSFYKQLSTNFQDLLDLFVLYSNSTSQIVKEQGDMAMGYIQTRHELLIKRDIIRIIQIFITSYVVRDNGNGEFVDLNQLCNRFVPLLLNDFTNAPDCIKEPLTLQFLAAMIEKLKNSCSEMIPTILSSVYLPSLQLITSNRLHYSDLCLSFYTLMENLTKYSFQHIFAFAEEEQKMLVDSIIWGYKDKERLIYESSLQTMITIISNVRSCNDDFKQSFYRSFFVHILENTLDVLTDSMHIPALYLIAQLLHLLFTILGTAEISVPIFPNLVNCYSNGMALCNHLTQYLFAKFPTCAMTIINDYILALGNMYQKTDNDYKVLSRDFLIQLKTITNMDVDLYAEEKEAARQQAIQADFQRRSQVPGMIGVNEMKTEYDQF